MAIREKEDEDGSYIIQMTRPVSVLEDDVVVIEISVKPPYTEDVIIRNELSDIIHLLDGMI